MVKRVTNFRDCSIRITAEKFATLPVNIQNFFRDYAETKSTRYDAQYDFILPESRLPELGALLGIESLATEQSKE